MVLGSFSLLLAAMLVWSTGILDFGLLLGGYLILNILYSLFLKKIPILDLAILGIGFLIRISSGGVLVDVAISEWLVIMTFLGALMMGLGKKKG